MRRIHLAHLHVCIDVGLVFLIGLPQSRHVYPCVVGLPFGTTIYSEGKIRASRRLRFIHEEQHAHKVRKVPLCSRIFALFPVEVHFSHSSHWSMFKSSRTLSIIAARNIQVITFLPALLPVEPKSRQRKYGRDQDLAFLLVDFVPELPPPSFFELFRPVFLRGR